MKTITERRISASLNVVVDLKVSENADIKNLIERLECECVNASGEDAKIIDVRIVDRNLLLEADEED
ncbi:MAG: hypothetical protein AB1480_08530 [Nitrospirota bacterium]